MPLHRQGGISFAGAKADETAKGRMSASFLIFGVSVLLVCSVGRGMMERCLSAQGRSGNAYHCASSHRERQMRADHAVIHEKALLPPVRALHGV